MVIEVEIRAFVTEKEYERLLALLKKEGEHLGEESQETHYFDCEEDIRIQKSDSGSKIWMKKGKLHDDTREEVEVLVDKEDFSVLESIFGALGFGTEIMWFRTRHTFKWKNVEVMLDHTKGYGHIIELEKLTDEQGKEAALLQLKEKLALLGVKETPKEEFSKRYLHYKENWQELTQVR